MTLYEVFRNGPEIKINGSAILGTCIYSLSDARQWLLIGLSSEQVGLLIDPLEADISLDSTRLETSKPQTTTLRTQFDNPEQQEQYARGIKAILETLRGR